LPLNPLAFNYILKKIGGIFNNSIVEDISKLEQKYSEAVPEVKERVTRSLKEA
jgi:hypothetical protein